MGAHIPSAGARTPRCCGGDRACPVWWSLSRCEPDRRRAVGVGRGNDDAAVRDLLAGYSSPPATGALAFPTAERFWTEAGPSDAVCLILDVHLPGVPASNCSRRSMRAAAPHPSYSYPRLRPAADRCRSHEERREPFPGKACWRCATAAGDRRGQSAAHQTGPTITEKPAPESSRRRARPARLIPKSLKPGGRHRQILSTAEEIH